MTTEYYRSHTTRLLCNIFPTCYTWQTTWIKRIKWVQSCINMKIRNSYILVWKHGGNRQLTISKLIILKCMLRTYSIRKWIRFIKPRIGSNGKLLWTWQCTFGCHIKWVSWLPTQFKILVKNSAIQSARLQLVTKGNFWNKTECKSQLKKHRFM
jgi:hypothetical protein